jgi:hypothetical protein
MVRAKSPRHEDQRPQDAGHFRQVRYFKRARA